MPVLRARPRKLTLRLSEEEFRRWEHVRRSLSDGEAVPPHADELMLILELAEETSPRRLSRMMEHWQSRGRVGSQH